MNILQIIHRIDCAFLKGITAEQFVGGPIKIPSDLTPWISMQPHELIEEIGGEGFVKVGYLQSLLHMSSHKAIRLRELNRILKLCNK